MEKLARRDESSGDFNDWCRGWNGERQSKDDYFQFLL